MATFYENLRNTFSNLIDDTILYPSKSSPKKDSNDIIDFFQYADDSSTEEIMDYHKNNRTDLQYTPFAWSDGARTRYYDKDGKITPSYGYLTGLVVSGHAPGSNEIRILGVELDDGRTLTSTGAKNFFNDLKGKGTFKFSDQNQLWTNKEKGDWPLQPGNPFIFNNKRKTIDNSGTKTFESGRQSGYENILEAQNFFKNLRRARGRE